MNADVLLNLNSPSEDLFLTRYGDTTPRSVQARIYGLIWIVVGITILSVFTATVTTVLTQESLGDHHRILGRKVNSQDIVTPILFALTLRVHN